VIYPILRHQKQEIRAINGNNGTVVLLSSIFFKKGSFSMKQFVMSAALAALLGVVGVAQAQVTAVPNQVTFQGRLANASGNPVPDGTYTIKFSFYDAATGGTLKREETVSNVQVKNGTFAVVLDASTAGLFSGELWLEIKIGTDTPLSPRQKVLSVPFAFKANTVPDGAIGTAQIANTAVNNAKLTDNAVTAAKLNNEAGSLSKVSGGNLFLTNNRLIYPNGTIQNTGASLGTLDLGLYSQINGQWIRFVTNNAPFVWFTDNNAGSNSRMVLNELGQFSLNSTHFQAMFINSANVTGTWQNLVNSSTGGRSWSLISTGSGNGEGAGNLLFHSQGTTAAILKPTGEFSAKIVTVTGGSDVAEPYHIAPAKSTLPLPGMVVSIDPHHVGKMRVASKPYDRTVAGIISGANGIKPGITLRQTGTVADGTLPVASIGRVWCWCDADANGAIQAGDMLTTSKTAGHAMKVTQHSAANGAVIGKAMSSLKKGKGLVLVLVSLK
jgi:hypothetical protein